MFVIEQFQEPEIVSLVRWGNVEEVCGRLGRLLRTLVLNELRLILSAIEDVYERVMLVDSAHECLC